MLWLSSPQAGQISQPPAIASPLPRFVGCHPSLAHLAACFGLGFPDSSNSIVSCLQCRKPGFNSWVRKIPWRREWQPTPVSCLENPMDGGAWWATVYGVTKSQTRLNDFTHFQSILPQKSLLGWDSSSKGSYVMKHRTAFKSQPLDGHGGIHAPCNRKYRAAQLNASCSYQHSMSKEVLQSQAKPWQNCSGWIFRVCNCKLTKLKISAMFSNISFYL